MFDLIMPTVLLAQAFGRWGNFMNQEAYGGIVPESFFAHYPAFIKNQMFIDGAYRMPTFLFESVCNLLGLLHLFSVSIGIKDAVTADLCTWFGMALHVL